MYNDKLSSCFSNFIMADNINADFVFPFHFVTDSEFSQMFLNYDIFSDAYDLKNVLGERDACSLDDKDDMLLPDNYHSLNKTLFATIEELNQLNISADSLTLLQINSRSLKCNLNAIKNLLFHMSAKPSIISVSETWLKPSDKLSSCTINGYDFISAPRKNNKSGGGSGLYISNLLSYIIYNDPANSLPEDVCDACAVELINDKAPNVIIVSLYRPPNTDVKVFDLKLSKYIKNIIASSKNKKLILTADWNIDFLKASSNSVTDQFLNNMLSFGLLPTITVPTRITETTATLLDNFFTNFSLDKILTRAIYDDISDHLPILINIAEKHSSSLIHPSPEISTSLPIFNTFNAKKFENYLATEDWSLLNKNDIALPANAAFDLFLNKFKTLFDKAFKSNKPQPKRDKNSFQPWMTSSLIRACRKKSRLLKIYKKTKTISSRTKYIAYKNILKQSIKHEEIQYYEKEFHLRSKDIRKTWQLINKLINKNPPGNKWGFFNINNSLTSNKQIIATAFNDYFTDLGPNLAKSIPQSSCDSAHSFVSPITDSMVVFPTDPAEIKNIIINLKSNTASGLDQVPVSVLKSVVDIISPILSCLINHSINSCSFPDALKSAKITPVFKSGDKTKIINYRPISLLSTFSKIYEKVFSNRLLDYINVKNILHDNQFGFRKNRSTQLALISFVDIVSAALENQDYVVSIFIDLSKAFDTIDHTILLRKLHNYGIRGVSFDYLKSYLTDRTQCVDIDGTLSNLNKITCGVPQGSILGPILFLLYINDLHNCSKILKLLLFADDTTLIFSSSDLKSLVSTLNKELALVYKWFNLNKLSLNVQKTKYMIFSNHVKETVSDKISIGDIDITRVNNIKFLGIEMDDKLTWLHHIRSVESKISSAIFIIRSIRYKISTGLALKLYDTLISPFLIYCVVIWGNSYKTHILHILRLQKRALKLCYGKCLSTGENVFVITNKLSLQSLYNLQTGKLIFKFFYSCSTLPCCTASLFKKISDVHSIQTRLQNDLCLHVHYSRLNTRKFSVKINAPILWNSIPLSLNIIKVIYY